MCKPLGQTQITLKCSKPAICFYLSLENVGLNGHLWCYKKSSLLLIHVLELNLMGAEYHSLSETEYDLFS